MGSYNEAPESSRSGWEVMGLQGRVGPLCTNSLVSERAGFTPTTPWALMWWGWEVTPGAQPLSDTGLPSKDCEEHEYDAWEKTTSTARLTRGELWMHWGGGCLVPPHLDGASCPLPYTWMSS